MSSCLRGCRVLCVVSVFTLSLKSWRDMLFLLPGRWKWESSSCVWVEGRRNLSSSQGCLERDQLLWISCCNMDKFLKTILVCSGVALERISWKLSWKVWFWHRRRSESVCSIGVGWRPTVWWILLVLLALSLLSESSCVSQCCSCLFR